MVKCPVCKRQVDNLVSGVKNGKYISERCQRCLNNTIHSAEFYRRNERQYQRREYAKDILQPWEEGYAKAYGGEAAREAGWSDDQLRQHG